MGYAIGWDGQGDKKYETGLKMGVLYPINASGAYKPGVAWSGLTAVNESPEGAEATDLYADDAKYITLRSAENFKGTIEAYTYPDEFAALNGEEELMTGEGAQLGVRVGQQKRGVFGLCYRTIMGNDVSADNYGYKLHLVYGCTVSPSEKAYKTTNDSPEAISFSWEFSSNPVSFKSTKQTSILTIDSTKFTSTAAKAKLAEIETMLYGSDDAQNPVVPELPLPDKVIEILSGD